MRKDYRLNTTTDSWQWSTYFILDPVRQLVKIGMSKNPDERFCQIKATCWAAGLPTDRFQLIGVIEGNVENDWHRAFRHLRAIGEWFQADGELLSAIEEKSFTLEFARKRRCIVTVQRAKDRFSAMNHAKNNEMRGLEQIGD